MNGLTFPDEGRCGEYQDKPKTDETTHTTGLTREMVVNARIIESSPCRHDVRSATVPAALPAGGPDPPRRPAGDLRRIVSATNVRLGQVIT